MHIVIGLVLLLLVASLAATPAQRASNDAAARRVWPYSVAFFVFMMAVYYGMYQGYL